MMYGTVQYGRRSWGYWDGATVEKWIMLQKWLEWIMLQEWFKRSSLMFWHILCRDSGARLDSIVTALNPRSLHFDSQLEKSLLLWE